MIGLGLRDLHYKEILEQKPQVSWFEALSDNYLGLPALPMQDLLAVRAMYPVSLHGVGMSLGSTDPLNRSYVQRLKELIQVVDPIFVSDHLSWSSVNQQYAPDLLPLPYTEEALAVVVDRIKMVQDLLGRRILIENLATHLTFKHTVLSEWDFLSNVAKQADCDILLDISNIYINAKNQGFSAVDYLKAIPKKHVKEFHLAGFEDDGEYLLDLHNTVVHPEVWSLYEAALCHFGPTPTLVEWDSCIPSFSTLWAEGQKAEKVWSKVFNDPAYT